MRFDVRMDAARGGKGRVNFIIVRINVSGRL